MNKIQWLLIVALLGLTQAASALVYSTKNLVQNGGFEDGDAPWTYGNASTYRSAASARTGDFGLQMDPTASYWSTASQNVTIFRGRMCYYVGRFQAPHAYVSANRMLLDGAQLFSAAIGAGYWGSGYGGYAIPGEGPDTVVLQIRSTVGHNQTAVYWDDISLVMERSVPDPNHDSQGGYLALGEPAVVSIYGNTGSMNIGGSTYNVAFDPDITVSSAQAVIGNVTWVSDTQIEVEVTATTAGDINLTLRNEYSELEAVHTMKAYFDGPFTLDENTFPIVMMGMATHTGGFSDVVASGCDYIHAYALGPRAGQNVADAVNIALDFLDLAYEYGFRVMVGINATAWWDQPDAVSIVQQYVNGVKDHPALGFWYLADEPEFKAPGSAFEPLYNAIKAITPDVPVASAHAWVANWNTFANAEDISMPDNYPVRDQPFPDAPIDQTTNWTRMHLQHYADNEVIPIMQSYNRSYDGSCTDCDDYRFPTVEELRYWAYGNLVQGVRGITWYCYYCARSYPGSNPNLGAHWLADIFIEVNSEFSAFTKLVAPAHQGQRLMNGQAEDDHIFAGFWNRPTGLWLVVVNNSSSARQLEVTTSPALTNAVLIPWGQSRQVNTVVEQGQVTLDAQPWETLVFEAKLPADLNLDDYVDVMDLAEFAGQWLQTTDPAQ